MELEWKYIDIEFHLMSNGEKDQLHSANIFPCTHIFNRYFEIQIQCVT